MRALCLGHLENTLVRALLDHGYRVCAGVRDTSNTASFAGRDCEVVQAELLDALVMGEALQGGDVLFQVAAVFKLSFQFCRCARCRPRYDPRGGLSGQPARLLLSQVRMFHG